MLVKEVDVVRTSHEGRGIAYDENGKIILVAGALAHEQVRCRIVKQQRKYADATLVEVLANSNPDRIVPACQHFLQCGGCSLQHLPISNQLSHKTNTVLEQLQHAAVNLEIDLSAPLVANPWHYRHKARVGVKYLLDKNKVIVGFRKQHGHHLTEIHGCKILPEKFVAIIPMLEELFLQLENKSFKQIELAITNNAIALVLRHTDQIFANDLELIAEHAKEHNYIVMLQPGSPNSVHKIYPKDDNLLLEYTLEDFALTFNFHPLDFVQINPYMNRLMLQQAMSWLDIQKHEVVLDLFCGLGNFSLPAAQYAKAVVGVEGTKEMVDRASKNAKLNSLNNVSFYAADLQKVSKNNEWQHIEYDKIILDPPRSGAAEIIPYVIASNAKSILYVSCNSATFARDCGLLLNNSEYKLMKLGLMDMFSHTAHVELMALFVKR